MRPRSKATKIADGHKATATKIAQWGPGELKRAYDQSIWTKAYRGQPREKNPFIREKIYSDAERDRAKKFRLWRKQQPGRDNAENPFRADAGKPRMLR